MTTPTAPNPQHLSFDQLERSLLADYRRAPKLKAVDPNDDPDFIERVKHVLLPKEKLMQFVARTGLGRTQALAMSRSEITAFCAQAERNRQNEPSTAIFAPRPIPAKITVPAVDFI